MGFSKNPLLDLLKSKVAEIRPPFWILTPKCNNKIFSESKQFTAMLSIDNLKEVVHGLYKEP